MLTGKQTSNYHFLLRWILTDTQTNANKEIQDLRNTIYAQLLTEKNAEKPNLLYLAILCRQPIATIIDLLDRDPDLLYGNENDQPYNGDPLKLAISQDNTAYCKILLNTLLKDKPRKFLPYQGATRGYLYYQHPLLKLAIENQNTAIVTTMLTTIIDIENMGMRCKEKFHELFLLAVEFAAMPGGNINIVIVLLNANKKFVDVSINKTGEETLPINFAIKWGNEPLVSLMLMHGFDANGITNVLGETTNSVAPALPPLQVAIENGYTNIVAELLHHGADVNQCSLQPNTQRLPTNTLPDNTPLHAALISGKETIIELLLKYNVNGYAKNAAGITPLDIVRAHPSLQKYESPLLEKTLRYHLEKTKADKSSAGFFSQKNQLVQNVMHGMH